SQFDATVRELLSSKGADKSLWGWKHSRTLLTYDLFLPYLVNPHFILVFRNPLGTALSSVEHTRKYRHPVDFSEALKIAHFYHAEMLRFLENHRETSKLLVSYEDILADPSKEAAKMAGFLGLVLSDEKARAIAEFVLPRERLQAEKEKRRSVWRGKLPRLIHKWSRKI
ncbi:MAG: sulfotransferase, partial [Candidatus Binatia bacterium]